jgi:hypothetical protein
MPESIACGYSSHMWPCTMMLCLHARVYVYGDAGRWHGGIGGRWHGGVRGEVVGYSVMASPMAYDHDAAAVYSSNGSAYSRQTMSKTIITIGITI